MLNVADLETPPKKNYAIFLNYETKINDMSY